MPAYPFEFQAWMWRMCYECGGRLNTGQPYRYLDVRHEKNSPDTMRIYANERCILGSPNEAQWQQAVRVQPGEQEGKG